MTVAHEYHSPDNTPALYVAPVSDNGTALQLTGHALTNANALSVAIVDAAGAQVTSFGGGTQYVNGVANAGPTGTLSLGYDGTNLRALLTDSSGLLKNNLTQVGGATFALGQQTSAASLPIVLTAAQLSTLTPPAAISNYANETGGNLATLAGAVTSSVVQANVKQINGVTVSMGSGIMGTGTQRVAIASDNDALIVKQTTGTNLHMVVDSGTITTLTGITNALPAGSNLLGKVGIDQTTPGTTNLVALTAETTKVIGTVRNSDGGGNLWTSNSTTYTAKFGQDSNLLGTLGTAFSTAGKVDVKAIDGDVFVRQTTGTNLHTVVDSGTITTLTNQTQEGGVNISLNAGAVDTGTRRVVQANGAGKTIVSVGGNAASSGNNTLVAAGTNKLKVFAFSLSTTSTTSVLCIFQSGAGGTELWRVRLQAPTSVSTGANLAVSPPAWLFATASATLLNLNLSGAISIDWSVSYFDEA